VRDTAAAALQVGATVRDAATGRVGVLLALIDLGNPYGHAGHKGTGVVAFLRPVGGGLEWETKPESVEPTTQ
jgi:hypothetical protein